ncbi:diguanylate cyclase (GGDEF)-like protein [Asanoa ferruginea]|uniref:Diguanylate cyclase (GGDEF)-like protein n=1 Tax=Asanoa ferruginea TaxID=53367 RepID=A0A3D9ZVE5_9ACTN|nr:diguanylate cyclase (GGDEF)-like protein [Asanoa ferruginea]
MVNLVPVEGTWGGRAPQTTLHRLTRPVLTVAASETCGRVDELFRADDTLRCVVVDDGQRRGLVMRESFGTMMAGPFGFGRALRSRQLIGELTDWSPLRLSADTPVEAAALLARGRPANQTYDDVLVEEDGAVAGRISAAEIFDGLARLYAHRATHDELTGLANRSFLLDRLAAACADAGRGGDRVLLAYVDLDGLKRINDTHGHQLGDAVLVVAGQRMARAALSGELVARLGGDEFAVLARLPQSESAEAAARALGERYVLAVTAHDGHLAAGATVTASVGVAVSGRVADPQSVLSEADMAMYQAKQSGGGRTAVVTGVGAELSHRLGASDLSMRDAIRDGQLRLFYQPIVDVRDGAIVGIEALVRWLHPRLGLLAPERFLPEANRAGHVPDLDRWVLNQACADMAAIVRDHDGQAPPRMNVNVSAATLALSIDDHVAAALAASGLPGNRLALEISEDADLETLSKAMPRLEKLRQAGVGLVLDDMGSGSTSLRYLSRLPLQGLKIDRTFVGGVVHNTGDYTVVKLLADLAHGLGIGVTAEGVETPDQLAALLDLGIHSAQGFHLGRPQPLEAFAAKLASAGEAAR